MTKLVCADCKAFVYTPEAYTFGVAIRCKLLDKWVFHEDRTKPMCKAGYLLNGYYKQLEARKEAERKNR